MNGEQYLYGRLCFFVLYIFKKRHVFAITENKTLTQRLIIEPDKRKVISNEEIVRLLLESQLIFADESVIFGTRIDDIDAEAYKAFIQKKYQKSFDDLGVGFEKSLENLDLLKTNQLTLSGKPLVTRPIRPVV